MSLEVKDTAVKAKTKNVWSWIPTLYFTQGIPYIVVMSVAVAMYKNLGLSNTDIALYTSYLNLPWVIKPLWSPLVDALKTKRWWIIVTQLIMGGAFALTAMAIPSDSFVSLTLAALALVAFNSATHDIAADGMYIISLSEEKQSFYVGIRSSFYRVAMIAGQGGLVYLAGFLSRKYYEGNYFNAWTTVFYGLAVYLVIAGLYHIWKLPRVETANEDFTFKSVIEDFKVTFSTFFSIKNIGVHIGVLLLFRLGEAQLIKLAQPFLLDDAANGGLALTNEQVGIFYGTIGISMLTVGGIIGGMIVSKGGLKKWFFPMVLAINIPNSMYLLLAYFKPGIEWGVDSVIASFSMFDSLFEITKADLAIGSAIAFEQFSYGFAFTAYMMYMIYMTKDSGKYKTSHFAFATGFMALGMMLPGMPAGWLQEELGYVNFFWWVLISMIPMVVFYRWVKIDPEFGKKHK